MKNVMMPAMARKAHAKVEARNAAITEWADTEAFELGVNREEIFSDEIGVIAAGSTYAYAREALGEKASYLKLGIVNPLPVNAIIEFAKKVKKIYVIEELDDIIETHCIKLGVKVIGREVFPPLGEYNQAIIAKAILNKENEFNFVDCDVPARPPVLCPGCPHRGLYYALKSLNLYVSGDIGCYTLGAQAPLSMMDTCVCMGASVSALHGYNTARGSEAAKKSIAVIGDSTFIHSGITGLIDIVYNKGISTVIVLDNSITGMTGHQNNPLNGKTIKGDPTTAVDLVSLAKAIGINRVRVVDPFDIKGTKAAVEEELQAEEPSLVISRRPCALLKSVKHEPALVVDQSKCVGCKACLKVGCPAISQKKQENGKTKAFIDPNQCLGCGVCVETCRLDAIIKNN
jgi:indolepyruvate ferredoxin oxidoreductase alpha subunit